MFRRHNAVDFSALGACLSVAVGSNLLGDISVECLKHRVLSKRTGQEFAHTGSHQFDNQLGIAGHRGHQKSRVGKRRVDNLEGLQSRRRLSNVDDDNFRIRIDQLSCRPIGRGTAEVAYFDCNGGDTRLHGNHRCTAAQLPLETSEARGQDRFREESIDFATRN